MTLVYKTFAGVHSYSIYIWKPQQDRNMPIEIWMQGNLIGKILWEKN